MTKRSERIRRGKKRRLGSLVRQTPREILREIFHRLPLYPMSRLKLICKEWNSVISYPEFVIEDNRRRSLSKTTHIIVSVRVDPYKFELKFYALDLSGGPTLRKDEGYWFGCSTNPRILGSYNGLVALACNDDNKYMLCDPSTQKYTSFLGVCVRKPNSFRFKVRILYGLCYDDSSHGYSIVETSRYENCNNNWCTVLTNLSTGAKKKLSYHATAKGFRFSNKRKLLGGGTGKVICGYPHWLLSFQDIGNPVVQREIIYFDFKDEVYKQLERPRETTNEGKKVVGFSTLGGERELGMVVHASQSSSLEVWVMKEHGNINSWSNVLVIPTSLFKRINNSDYIELLGYILTGEILIDVNLNKELWAYDVANGRVRQIKLGDGTNRQYDATVTCYHPSRISPTEV